MKDIKTAEEYWEIWIAKESQRRLIPPLHNGEYYLSETEFKKFAEDYAEYYHKAKIEAISDEEIVNQYTPNGIKRVGLYKFAKWFKNKLLNDL